MCDEEILKYFNNFKSVRKINWKKLPKEIENYLEKRFDDEISYKETYARIKYNIKENPICPICGKKLKFINRLNCYPYQKYCSYKCRSNDKEWLNKQKETKKQHYGDSNYNNREKYKETCLSKYNVDNPFKSEEIKEVIKQTKFEKYGNAYYNNKEQVYKTNNEKIGVNMPFQSQEILNKCKETLKQNLGVENPMYSSYIVENMKNNYFLKTGYTWSSKNPENINKVKETCLKRYGATTYFSSKEWLEYIKNEEFQEKRKLAEYNTKKKNNSFNISKQEEKCYELLKEKYNEVIRQYTDKRYPFRCDFYIPKLDLFIEYQGSQTHGFHEFDENNIDDINKYNDLIKCGDKICKKYNKKKSLYYAMGNIWRYTDAKKRNIAKENNLNYIEFWNLEEVIKFCNNYD